MIENNTQIEGAAENNSPVVTPETNENEIKTYTEQEVAELLQREGDRRVTSALKKQQKQFESKIAEAEKLRGMDEAQRQQYEFEQKVKELEAREKEFNLAQNKLEASKVLANRNLPVEFVDYIDIPNWDDNQSVYIPMFETEDDVIIIR